MSDVRRYDGLTIVELCQTPVCDISTQAVRDLVNHLRELHEFTPTAEQVNELPEGLRRFIHDLETRCDPAGDTAQLTLLKDQRDQLGRGLAGLSSQHRDLRCALTAVASVIVAETDRLTDRVLSRPDEAMSNQQVQLTLQALRYVIEITRIFDDE